MAWHKQMFISEDNSHLTRQVFGVVLGQTKNSKNSYIQNRH